MIDHFSAARRHAATVAEYFNAFADEGFSEEEAFALTKTVQDHLLIEELLKPGE